MRQNREELEKDVIESFQNFREKIHQYRKDFGHNYDLLHHSYFYSPDKVLVKELIDEIDSYYQKPRPTQKERQLAGYKLEELTLAVFHGLRGWSSIKSYRSASSQYDLLMSGEGLDWKTALSLLPLKIPEHLTSIVVEAKATKAKVNDAQFARLCSIMQTNLKNTSILGVFFTLKGASGFANQGKKTSQNVGNARLRQLLFYIDTGKPVIVLDINDIRTLAENGTFLRIIGRKIQEIEELTGLPTSAESIAEVVLPENLRKLYERLRLTN
ncbi:hypothetical protein U2F10_35970 [Leptothoe sp. EHU-05/26/07-4]